MLVSIPGNQADLYSRMGDMFHVRCLKLPAQSELGRISKRRDYRLPW